MSKYVGKIVTNQAPAGYSVFFDGTGDYLTVANNAAFQLGTGDFTIECWYYAQDISLVALVGLWGPSSSNASWLMYLDASGNPQWYTSTNGSTQTASLTSSRAITLNAWNHIAFSRVSGTTTIYVNGVSGGSTSTVINLFAATSQLSIGYNPIGGTPDYAVGYISNVRIVKGTALYTAAFTPPTQLLNVTNTSLLTCNSPVIVDQSSNAFAITTNGNAAVSTFTPFTAYNPAPTSSNPLTPAPGVWTLDEALQYTQQGVWPSYAVNAIEDVFSTYLYTGNGSTQTITNNIDLAGKGGMVWIKSRNDTYDHFLYDTARGATKSLQSDTTSAEQTYSDSLTAFNSNGFALGANVRMNANTTTYASWTFREQAKFFDVVTFTGNGAATQTLNHNLGSVPGVIIFKAVSTTGSWLVYHRSIPNSFTRLNTDGAALNAGVNYWNPTSTTIDATSYYGNDTGVTYVAYLFAHNAGGFGATGADNVITCGSYTGTGGANTNSINLGYEPQWVLFKSATASASGSWFMNDVMRGASLTSSNQLLANTSDAESSNSPPRCYATATGFDVTGNSQNWSGDTYIYIAIRRGPMRPPTSGTSVFTPVLATSSGNMTFVAGFPVDMWFHKDKSSTTGWRWWDRLRDDYYLDSATTGAENSFTAYFDSMTQSSINAAGNFSSVIGYPMRRAPGFLDVVCYTGTGVTNRVVDHNLGVAPEMMIIKIRNNYTPGVDASGNWPVYHAALGNQARLALNLTNAETTGTGIWYSTTPTATTFKTSGDDLVNKSASGYVAYLFATVGGVSKVGSYTGTGTTQQINCGFTNGSRFVMIKRTDSTGAWYVWDSARGIVAGNDPYLLLNSTAAEVTNTDYVDTYSAGFELSSTAPADLNASGGNYIFLAIA